MDDIFCQSCGAKVEIAQSLRTQVEGKVKTEYDELLKAKDKQLQEMGEQEIRIRKEKALLEEKGRTMELEVVRKVDASKKELIETVSKQMTDHFHLKEEEYKKQIEDLKKLAEESSRKAGQGSQQLQGEVQEEDLKHQLLATYPDDLVEDVDKGIRGADLRQVVRTSRGNECGVILWEAKRTKAWSDEWVVKLKDDQRSEKAYISVIVSQILPRQFDKSFGPYDGVWICQPDSAIPLAGALRDKLIEVARAKYVTTQRSSNAEAVYDYVTGHEFIQQVESMVEVYYETIDQITKERAAFETIWKRRESQALRLKTSMANIIGSLQGKAGPSLPKVKGLELLED